MFRFLFRTTGLLFLAAAFAALLIDATRSIGGSMLLVTPLGEALAAKLGPLQSNLERLHPILWDPIGRWIMHLPLWLVLCVLAFILLRLSQRPAPRVGYTSRP